MLSQRENGGGGVGASENRSKFLVGINLRKTAFYLEPTAINFIAPLFFQKLKKVGIQNFIPEGERVSQKPENLLEVNKVRDGGLDLFSR